MTLLLPDKPYGSYRHRLVVTSGLLGAMIWGMMELQVSVERSHTGVRERSGTQGGWGTVGHNARDESGKGNMATVPQLEGL